MSRPKQPFTQEDEPLSLDKILRTLTRRFFQDFMEILFPDVAVDIDFSAVKFVGGKHFAHFRKKGHVSGRRGR
jgi:hypothetical protein